MNVFLIRYYIKLWFQSSDPCLLPEQIWNSSKIWFNILKFHDIHGTYQKRQLVSNAIKTKIVQKLRLSSSNLSSSTSSESEASESSAPSGDTHSDEEETEEDSQARESDLEFDFEDNIGLKR